MSGLLRLLNFYLNCQDNPLSKMSVAKLKEEGNKALDKDDYDAALKFYNMVCHCTIRSPEVHFFFPYHCCLICIYCNCLYHYLMYLWMLLQTIHLLYFSSLVFSHSS
jgi:hypothetical protein